MKKKIVWHLASSLLVVTLVLASCGPAAEEEEEVALPPEEEEVVPPEEEEKLAPAVEMPKYGGWLTMSVSTSALYFDDTFGHPGGSVTMPITNEELLGGDWTKGPAGSGDTMWVFDMGPRVETRCGELAESWEIVDPDTVIWHIRKGVHWHNKPPVNGRELNADDVVFNLKRNYYSTRGYNSAEYQKYIESITATDKWTVVLKVNTPERLAALWSVSSDHLMVFPPETIEEYGDMADWRNSCGTGPFMLEDYVNDSSYTLIRNPNYWDKDPIGVGKGNQLPYIDGLKILIITDLSTQLAATRTARIDWIPGVTWDDAASLKKTSPELKFNRYLYLGCIQLHMRLDTSPFDDIRVRQALTMAIDYEAIRDLYYGGDAETVMYPAAPVPEHRDVYVLLGELPESVRELYGYNPEKARQLLVEAGYPDGFKTEILTWTAYSDILSIVKDYFADIGVDMKLDTKELGAWVGLSLGKKYTQMQAMALGSSFLGAFLWEKTGNPYNFSLVSDPIIDQVEAEVAAASNRFDRPAVAKILKDITPYMLEQCYFVQMPSPYVYTFWQPWIKNYNGELNVGYTNLFSYTDYIWIDQDLREEMTGRR